MSEVMEAPTEQSAVVSAPAKPLNEHVLEVVSAAPKKMGFAAVKSALKKAGVATTGKTRVTDEEIAAALEAEGIFKHPPKKEGGTPDYWHTRFKSPEELAAEKDAKAAEAKARKIAAADEKKRAAADAKAAKIADAQAKKDAEKARKVAEAEGKKRAAAEAKAAKIAEAAERKQAAAAEKEAIAQKKKDDAAAEKARIAAEAVQKRIEAIATGIRSKVESLGSKVVSPEQLFKLTAKHGEDERAEFGRVLSQLVEEKQLHEHPGGRYGASAPLPWFEKNKGQLESLVKAARKLTVAGVPLDEVIAKLREAADVPAANEPA